MPHQINMPLLPGFEAPHPQRRVFTKPRVAGALAIAAAATTLGLFGANHNAEPVANPAPYELSVDGDIDMDAAYADLKPSITAATTVHDSAGLEVITVGEYIAVPGYKTTKERADFANISPFAKTPLGDKLDTVVAADAAILNSLGG
jgi:hypothetical protein